MKMMQVATAFVFSLYITLAYKT